MVAQGCLTREPMALPTEQPSPTGHEIRHESVSCSLRHVAGGYSVNLRVLLALCLRLGPAWSSMESSAVLVFGAGRVDAAATSDLRITQQSLAGAVTHCFQLSWLPHGAQEFSSYRLVKYSRAGCLHPLEEWAQNQASPCLATPGCSFQPKAPCQAFSGEANITSADVLPFYIEHNKSFQDDLLS